jgi:hypothetical protein
MELPNSDVVVCKNSVNCIDDHFSNLLEKMSITSDDTIFSEDYILSAENDI